MASTAAHTHLPHAEALVAFMVHNAEPHSNAFNNGPTEEHQHLTHAPTLEKAELKRTYHTWRSQHSRGNSGEQGQG